MKAAAVSSFVSSHLHVSTYCSLLCPAKEIYAPYYNRIGSNSTYILNKMGNDHENLLCHREVCGLCWVKITKAELNVKLCIFLLQEKTCVQLCWHSVMISNCCQ